MKTRREKNWRPTKLPFRCGWSG